MIRHTIRMAALALALLLVAGPFASAQGPGRPGSLEECYLDVAAAKASADAVHLAREICDAVFQPRPRSLSALVGDKECVEWWFDSEGRYESAEIYCSLEPAEEQQWKLACQWKTPEKSYTFVKLRENAGRMEPVGGLNGRDVGPLFTSLGACIEARAKPASRS